MELSTLLEVPLAKLPDCVNSVLIQIGKVFRETSQRDAKVTSYNSKAQVQQIIIRANDRFHEALDDVEIQLLKAKAVMERDLALVRAKRAERERAAGVLRLRASNEGRSVAEHDGSKVATAETPDEYHTLVNDVKTEISADIKMVDTTADEISGLRPEHETTTDREEARTEPVEEIKELSETVETFPPALPKSHFRTPPQGFDVDNHDPNSTTHLSDVDFDSMFADAAAPNNNESLNFDIDFSTNTGISHDLLQDNPFGDLTTNNDFTNTSNENIDSLMPGIENYVNAHTTGNVSDDFAMLDMPATSAGFDNSILSKPVPDGDIDFTGIDAAAGTGMMDAAPVDSTFDDLFFDDSGDLGMGDGDISGDFGEFDDNWFKSDGQ
ncbi:hypothetical protein MMC18_002344 [Xylographa bjoerkii]|nr:hypothetical protein [Xylographa bjoerkii]